MIAAMTIRPAHVSSLASHTGFWLRLVSNHVSHGFARKLAGSGATVAEWVILREILQAGKTSPGRLATAIGLTRGAVSKLVDRLVRKELVSRTEAGTDRRFQDVELTAAGRARGPPRPALAGRTDPEFFSPRPAREREALLATLKKLVALHDVKGMPTT